METYQAKVFLLLYVDGILIASVGITKVKRVKWFLTFEYDMKNLGATRNILGIEILRDRKSDKLVLTQKSYLFKILKNLECSTQELCQFLWVHSISF